MCLMSTLATVSVGPMLESGSWPCLHPQTAFFTVWKSGSWAWPLPQLAVRQCQPWSSPAVLVWQRPQAFSRPQAVVLFCSRRACACTQAASGHLLIDPAGAPGQGPAGALGGGYGGGPPGGAPPGGNQYGAPPGAMGGGYGGEPEALRRCVCGSACVSACVSLCVPAICGLDVALWVHSTCIVKWSCLW